MPTRTIVIEGDRAHFLLAVDAGTVRVGDGPAHTAGLVRDVKVVRVRCEVEVEDDRDHIPVDEPGVLTKRAVRPGAPLQLGGAKVSLGGDAATPAPAVSEPSVFAAPITGPRRLKVIDGGDQGRTFRLPDAGPVTVGKVGAADIGLHDFYVTKVHCSLDVSADGVTVTHLDGPLGTLIDGYRIPGPRQLKSGSVLRVGNSHLRLEAGAAPDDTVVDSGSKQHAPVPAAPPAEAVTVGHYKLGRKLGAGYTGEVFEAVHDQTGQPVALKLLAPEFPAAPAELDGFVKELKAAQAVRHPNVVGLVGVGKTPTRCWIARELVPGESAADVVARVAAGEKPSWTRAARVVVHLARALDALHRHHVVHGTITPKNVLLRVDDHATKLADLKLTEALAGTRLGEKAAAARLKHDLPYRAPEQTEAGAFVDDLADLYAVGAVAYALIAGRPPTGGASRPAHVYKKVPAAFDAVVMKLLAPHQEDRYPSAAAVLADMAPIAETNDLKLG